MNSDLQDKIERIMGVVSREHRTCETHGDYETVHSVRGDKHFWSGCPICADELARQRSDDELAERRRQLERRRVERLLGHASIAPRFAEKTFDTYRCDTDEQARVARICREYAESFPEYHRRGLNLLMLGAPGTGKTHLAVAILADVIHRHGMAGVYTTAARMFRRIKATFGNDDESEVDAIDAYATPALLVLDEIGVSYGSDAELNYLFDILNERYEQCLPTIVVSNVQPGDMGRWLGERVVDRLRESSRLLLFGWESARRDIGKGGMTDA